MAYNSFYTSILIRLILLLLTITGIAYLFVMNDRFFSLLFLILMAIVQIILLFSYLNRTNRNLARFLLLLTEEETSVVAWQGRVERTFQGLHHSFEKVNAEISRIRLDKEKGTVLMQRAIDHISTGILATHESGRVEIVNEAALRLFGITKLENINEMEQLHQGITGELLKQSYDSGNIVHLYKGELDEAPLLVRVSLLRLEDSILRLYSLQNIKTQLEANEIESWQKMTRVLSHEISNSVTPISTLSAGIHRKLSQGKQDKEGQLILDKSYAEDLMKSAELIEERGNALVGFMEHYKSFARLPEPNPAKMELHSFFENLELFFTEDLNRSGVRLSSKIVQPPICIVADQKLLEQAFINLIRNASDALSGCQEGTIHLKAEKVKNQYVALEVSDNGPGIPTEIQKQLFIPFFTTKSGGTGIGLSIVRKIVLSSGGNISFHSIPGHGTKFVVKLPEC